jgi:hypothetical protein
MELAFFGGLERAPIINPPFADTARIKTPLEPLKDGQYISRWLKELECGPVNRLTGLANNRLKN